MIIITPHEPLDMSSEEDRRVSVPKHCVYNNQNEDNSSVGLVLPFLLGCDKKTEKEKNSSSSQNREGQVVEKSVQSMQIWMGGKCKILILTYLTVAIIRSRLWTKYR